MRYKILGIILLLIGVSTLIFPFFPLIKYEIGKTIFPINQTIDKNKYLKPAKSGDLGGNGANTVSLERRIVIPKIGVDVHIVEGQTEDAMLKGAWHYKNSSIPPGGGNMVLYGHRWRYLPPNNTTFYLIDKLTQGDKIYIFWDGVEYDYTVTDSKVVEPDAFYVLDQQEKSMLTLISCTPLFVADKRLVVTADLVGKSE